MADHFEESPAGLANIKEKRLGIFHNSYLAGIGLESISYTPNKNWFAKIGSPKSFQKILWKGMLGQQSLN